MKVALSSSALFTLLILQVRGIVPDGNSSNDNSLCRTNEKCFQCVQTRGCMWCKDKNPSLESRCFSNKSLTIQCKDIENPRGSVKEGTGDQEKLKGHGSHKIHPQVVELSLRKGEKRNITLEYTDEKSRPLDLYILMDLSCSMKKHKDKVSNLTSTLERNLKKLTSDLRMGFGSFVDKPLAPFGFLAPPDPTISRECEGERLQSIPYSFKNHLRLTDNVTQFIDGVKAAGISSNIEHPEGTLEGLLQSIVCTSQIGWRTGKGNRKLLVISTDGSFHLAGDGKLVGVVLPHDGVCYVDSSGMYTHSTIFDYPSVSLVRQKLKENDVFVIFAVTKDQEKAYSQLSQQLDQYAVTQSIDNNDNSIISVIGDEYKKLVNTIAMLSDYDQKDYVDIKVYVKCPGENDFLENNQCNEVGPGVTVSFKIEVELKDCPSKSSNHDAWKSNVTIYPRSSSADNMLIQLSMLCGCDCEADNPSKALTEPELSPSPECSNHGFVQCGICACLPRYGGSFCNCTTDDTGHVSRDQCVDPATGKVCNDRGICDSCGKCTCDPVDGNPNARIGKYCECDNTNCPLEPSVDKGICNKDAEDGPHGECKCSRCECKDGKFNGSRCECPTNDGSCRDPKSPDKTLTCNGIGSCHCGKCICGSTNKGKFCEIQYARLNGSCDAARIETEKCVKCLVSRYSTSGETDGAKSEHCEESCKGIAIVFSSRIDSVTVEEEENACKDFEIDKNGCRVDYIIKNKDITSGKILLEMDKGETVTREKCPTPAPVLGIVVAIIGAMVLIGIFLLLTWKVVTHVQDKREYERFEKAINEASWETQENPLYKSTTSQFKNPAYIDYNEGT